MGYLSTMSQLTRETFIPSKFERLRRETVTVNFMVISEFSSGVIEEAYEKPQLWGSIP